MAGRQSYSVQYGSTAYGHFKIAYPNIPPHLVSGLVIDSRSDPVRRDGARTKDQGPLKSSLAATKSDRPPGALRNEENRPAR